MKIMSLFTHPYVVPNILGPVEHRRWYFEILYFSPYNESMEFSSYFGPHCLSI